MSLAGKRESLILLVGDFLFFFLSLWVALFIRNLSLPGREVFVTHVGPFAFLFVVWIVVFYIAGLYEKHTVILQSRLPQTLFNAQLANSGLAVAFFYLLPFLDITPKTLLFIHLVVSFVLVFLWRRYGYFMVGRRKTANAILIGSGEEMRELLGEVNENPIYNLRFISSVDLDHGEGKIFWDEIISRIYAEGVSIIAIDITNEKVEPVLPHLYNLIFSKVNFVDMNKIYEDIFDKVPLSLLRYNWFLENISTTPRGAYDALKRLMDMTISFILLLLSMVVYPFVILAIKLDDRGEIFSLQTRVGENNRPIRVIKFRTMSIADDRGEWGLPTGRQGKEVRKNTVTRVGKVLRRYRIDELPQLWNVLVGDMSLIGPRPEFPEPVRLYSEKIPYYNIRHLIKPGLSGWAQIYHDNHPHHGIDTIETKNKLSYDLYYIKNRSFILDLKIALRTVKTLLSRSGI